MGRRGFGVGFGDTDPAAVPGPDAVLTPFAVLMEGLGDRIDDVSVAAVRVAAAQADQARAIEAARVWALQAALSMPGDDSRHARHELAERSFIASLASALRVSELSARNLAWAAECLAELLPLTLEYLSDGAITWRHVQVLVDQVTTLGPESSTMLEQQVLPRGRQQTPAQFARSVKRVVERLKEEDSVARHELAAEDRTAYAEPMRDGMARIVIEAPAVQVFAIDNYATDIARSLQVEGETRTFTQLKTDVMIDLLMNADNRDTIAGRLDGPVARIRHIRPRVLVTVPAMTLLRRGDDGAEPTPGAPERMGFLEGYGPIDPQSARELTGNRKSLVRILTDPDTGAALSIGRRRYRIPESVRLWLRYRDGICRFPGCARPAVRCEIDHVDEWAKDHGGTDHWNLEHLCPGHHTLKTVTGWTPTQAADGSGRIIWTSPTGHILATEPEHDVDPRQPNQPDQPHEEDDAA